MFFVLSKIGGFFVTPLAVVVGLLALGVALGFTRFRKTSQAFIATGALLLALISFTGFGQLLLSPLESRFQRPPEPARVDGIIVLGGGMDADVSGMRRSWELNASGDRFVEALRLAQKHPEARLLITGGFGSLVHGAVTEAESGERLFSDFGIEPWRLILEARARNTEENARYSLEIAAPKPGETWLLVTSAFHMPRAVGLFRKVGFEVVPWPTDYFTTGAAVPLLKPAESVSNLQEAQLALREWIGLAVYALTGKIDSVLPGP